MILAADLSSLIFQLGPRLYQVEFLILNRPWDKFYLRLIRFVLQRHAINESHYIRLSLTPIKLNLTAQDVHSLYAERK